MTTYLTKNGIENSRPVFDVNNEKGTARVTVREKCHRCGGLGGSDAWAYTGWTCYRCAGNGMEAPRNETVYTPEAYAKYRATCDKRAATAKAKRDAKEAKRQEAIATTIAAFKAENSELVAKMETSSDYIIGRTLVDLNAGKVPSEKQVALVRDLLVKEEEKKAKDAEDRSLDFVGTVGERRVFTLTYEKVVTLTSYDPYGRECPFYIATFRAEGGEIVVYKGARLGELPREGETKKIKATIKKHDLYNGKKQTVINRPKAV